MLVYLFQRWVHFLYMISDDGLKLVLSERKSINTLSYLIVVLMAYFGPNAELLGNIKIAIWQFQRPITDIEAYVIKVSILLAVDLSSLVINGALLWCFCIKTNVFKILKRLQQQWWICFAIVEAFHLQAVRSII